MTWIWVNDSETRKSHSHTPCTNRSCIWIVLLSDFLMMDFFSAFIEFYFLSGARDFLSWEEFSYQQKTSFTLFTLFSLIAKLFIPFLSFSPSIFVEIYENSQFTLSGFKLFSLFLFLYRDFVSFFIGTTDCHTQEKVSQVSDVS